MTPTTPTTPPAIDFADVRSRCPRAFAALDAWAETLPDTARTIEWLGIEREMSSDLNAYFVPRNPRDLFDFFDQQGMIVTIESMMNNGEPIFYGKFLIDGVYSVADGKIHPTRAAAEAAAFMAGFEKLEEMINQKEG